MKLFNNDLVNLKKDVVVVDVEAKFSSPTTGVACRACNFELFKIPNTVTWQCPGCNAKYEDKRYAKSGDEEITTSDGVSELEASSAGLISVDSYDMYKLANATPEDSRKKYRKQIFGRLPGARIIAERDSPRI